VQHGIADATFGGAHVPISWRFRTERRTLVIDFVHEYRRLVRKPLP
jgi:hypothetical protein